MSEIPRAGWVKGQKERETAREMQNTMFHFSLSPANFRNGCVCACVCGSVHAFTDQSFIINIDFLPGGWTLDMKSY